MQTTPREGSAVKSLAAWVRFLAIVAAGIAADLVTKHWAWQALANEATRWPADRVAALERHLLILELVWQPNYGAVFGLGAGKTTFFIGFTVVALGLLLWLFADSRKNQLWFHALLACIVAGALGNLYDRALFGYVRDFLRFSLRADWAAWGGPERYLWPYVFNVADALITIGVIGLFLIWTSSVFHRREPAAAKPAKG